MNFALHVTPTNQLSHRVQDAFVCQGPRALSIEMAMDTSEKEIGKMMKTCCILFGSVLRIISDLQTPRLEVG